jgi:hypothetical protein
VPRQLLRRRPASRSAIFDVIFYGPWAVCFLEADAGVYTVPKSVLQNWGPTILKWRCISLRTDARMNSA